MTSLQELRFFALSGFYQETHTQKKYTFDFLSKLCLFPMEGILNLVMSDTSPLVSPTIVGLTWICFVLDTVICMCLLIILFQNVVFFFFTLGVGYCVSKINFLSLDLRVYLKGSLFSRHSHSAKGTIFLCK